MDNGYNALRSHRVWHIEFPGCSQGICTLTPVLASTTRRRAKLAFEGQLFFPSLHYFQLHVQNPNGHLTCSRCVLHISKVTSKPEYLLSTATTSQSPTHAHTSCISQTTFRAHALKLIEMSEASLQYLLLLRHNCLHLATQALTTDPPPQKKDL